MNFQARFHLFPWWKKKSEFGQILEAINDYYSHLEEIIELQKYQTYNSILNKRASQEAEARMVKATLNEQI